MRRLFGIGLLLAAVTACSGGSPTAPSQPSPAPTPASFALTGHVRSLQTDHALANVTIDTITSDAAGAYTLTLPAGTQALTLSGSSIVSRRLYVTLQGARTLDLHPITLAGFDLTFYREFVRGKLDNPTLQPLRRLTAAPHVYLRTVDDKGKKIDAATLDMVEATIRQTAPIWSAGAFGVASVTRGTNTKKSVSGWLTVEWDPSLTTCGNTTVGTDGGVMTLSPFRAGCTCGTALATSPETVTHELGHAFGFWHTDSPKDVMWPQARCGLQPSARERAAAKIAYARPVGNTDPDNDPSSAVQIHAVRVP